MHFYTVNSLRIVVYYAQVKRKEVMLLAPSESQKRASLKWDKENMIVLGCKVKRSQAAAFKAQCEAQGKKSNAVLKDYVLSYIGESPQDGAEASTRPPQAAEGNITSEALKAAQGAAEATGEAIPQFVERAVVTQVDRDRRSLTMGINPATGEKMDGGDNDGN